jgi:hypothetical protein
MGCGSSRPEADAPTSVSLPGTCMRAAPVSRASSPKPPPPPTTAGANGPARGRGVCGVSGATRQRGVSRSAPRVTDCDRDRGATTPFDRITRRACIACRACAACRAILSHALRSDRDCTTHREPRRPICGCRLLSHAAACARQISRCAGPCW